MHLVQGKHHIDAQTAKHKRCHWKMQFQFLSRPSINNQCFIWYYKLKNCSKTRDPNNRFPCRCVFCCRLFSEKFSFRNTMDQEELCNYHHKLFFRRDNVLTILYKREKQISWKEKTHRAVVTALITHTQIWKQRNIEKYFKMRTCFAIISMRFQLSVSILLIWGGSANVEYSRRSWFADTE